MHNLTMIGVIYSSPWAMVGAFVERTYRMYKYEISQAMRQIYDQQDRQRRWIDSPAFDYNY